MAFPRSLRIVRDQAAIAEATAAYAAQASPVPHVRELSSLWSMIQADGANVTGLSTAMQVPAFVKALKTYTHTISAFPLKEYIGMDQTVARPFLNQPSPVTTYSSIMTRTLQDLLLRDVAYWRVTSRTWDGFPASIEYMPYSQISFTPDADYAMFPIPAYGTISWNGVPIPDRDVIRFDGDGTGGWLSVGAQAINTAYALEAAVYRYAESPAPSVVLKNTGADLPAEQVDQLLTAWEESRASRSTAYLNSTIGFESPGGWSPSEMQMNDARNGAAISIARLANLDPIWVGASISGTSLVYANRIDLYKQLLDLSLSIPMRLITERLSMNDVTPRGHRVAFDTSVFLKANVENMAGIVSQLLPLEVINIDEARDFIDLPDLMDVDQPGDIA